MYNRIKEVLKLGILVLLCVMLVGGCGTWGSVKQWAGYSNNGEDEDIVPPESQQETVMIDGKPYVRSKNPYWLSYPEQPEYIYVQKGKEFHGVQHYLMESLAKAIGREQQKAAGKTIPPDKLQEMVRAEVDRILREQGLGGFVSQGKGSAFKAVVGRAVAVVPDLDTPRSLDGLNRTLAMALGEAMGRTKDLKVADPVQVENALRKANIMGKLTLPPNIKTLGDALGVQGIVLTGVMRPEGGTPGAMALQVYNTFTGLQEDSLVAPAPPDGLKNETVTKFAKNNALRLTGDLLKISWFGRVEFVKDGKVYLNLGQNSGLKVGDRLKVVEPGKEVINPQTHSLLGYTADIPQGEIKVTELLGKSGAVGTPLKGGPFKANDKVKAVR
ncbi:MAG: hypothetical protein P8168_10030 [Deltaproteobacteria bacterium]|jgi:hypothetical protein